MSLASRNTEGVGVEFYSFLSVAVDGDMQSTSSSGCFTPGKNLGTH